MFKTAKKKAVLATYRVTDDGGCDGGSRRLVVPCGAFLLLLPSCRALPLPFSLFSFPFSLGFSLVFPLFSFLPFFSLFSFLSQVNK